MLNNEFYALKEIPKYKLYSYSKIYSHLKEPNILKKFSQSDFLPTIISSFQDYNNIYLITTFYEGKSLQFLSKENMTENQIKFVSACIIQSLAYLRKKKIIHRDLQFPNIIMDKKKYFNLIDFSFSIDYSHKDQMDKYLNPFLKVSPPEMIKFEKYYYNSDYYRLGSMIYYLLFKKYPNAVKLQNNITNIKLNYKDIKNYSKNFIDFLNKLIISDPKKRIGFKDINELKNHSWFMGYDWNNLEKKKLVSPFKLIKNKVNQRLCNKKISISNECLNRYKSNSKENRYKLITQKFNYVNKNIIKQILSFDRN